MQGEIEVRETLLKKEIEELRFQEFLLSSKVKKPAEISIGSSTNIENCEWDKRVEDAINLRKALLAEDGNDAEAIKAENNKNNESLYPESQNRIDSVISSEDVKNSVATIGTETVQTGATVTKKFGSTSFRNIETKLGLLENRISELRSNSACQVAETIKQKQISETARENDLEERIANLEKKLKDKDAAEEQLRAELESCIKHSKEVEETALNTCMLSTQKSKQLEHLLNIMHYSHDRLRGRYEKALDKLLNHKQLIFDIEKQNQELKQINKCQDKARKELGTIINSLWRRIGTEQDSTAIKQHYLLEIQGLKEDNEVLRQQIRNFENINSQNRKLRAECKRLRNKSRGW